MWVGLHLNRKDLLSFYLTIKWYPKKTMASQYTFEQTVNVQFYVLAFEEDFCKVADHIGFLYTLHISDNSQASSAALFLGFCKTSLVTLGSNPVVSLQGRPERLFTDLIVPHFLWCWTTLAIVFMLRFSVVLLSSDSHCFFLHDEMIDF